MAQYTYQLIGGKTLTLEGDAPPSDEEVESIAREQNVQLAPAEAPEPTVEQRLTSAREVLDPERLPEVPPAAEEVAEPGLFRRAYEKVSEPITTVPSRFAETISQYINPERQTRGLRGIGSAYIESLGDVISGLSSPLNLALAGTGAGTVAAARTGLPRVAEALNLATRGISAPVAYAGGERMLTGETLPERLMGAAEAVGGVMGVRSKVPQIAEAAAGRPPVRVPPAEELAARRAARPAPEVIPETAGFAKEIAEGRKIPDFTNIADNGSVWVENLYGKGSGGYARPEDLNFIYDTARMRRQSLPEPPPQIKSQMTPEAFGETIKDVTPARTGEFDPGGLRGLRRAAPEEDEVSALIREAGLEEAPQIELADEAARAINASAESAASAEALSRQSGMQARGEQFVVYDRAGNKRPLIGPDAVDYTPQRGETFGVETPRGFVKLNDQGGKIPAEASEITPKRKEGPGFRGIEGEEPPKRLAAEFGPEEAVTPPGQPPRKPSSILHADELDPSIPIQERRPPQEFTPSKLQQAYDLPRGLMSIDLPFMTSAAFRQASPLAWTGNWFRSWRSAAKAFSDEDAYQAVMNKVNSNEYAKPRYQPMYDAKGNLKSYKEMPSLIEEARLKLTDLGNISNREEFLRSQWAEKIPAYGRYVRASNRAYTAFLNDLRVSKFAELMDEAKARGINPERDLTLTQEMADFVNTATGRGRLEIGIGKRNIELEQNARLLTNTLFSPRLMASRIKFLNPSTYRQASPVARKEYIKGLARSVATWGSIAGLAELAGATVVKDPNSADFGKIKIGDTRLDPGAGFQQYVVLLSRMRPGTLGGGFTSSVTGEQAPLGEGYKPKTRASLAMQFMVNKLHPVARFAWDLMSASQDEPVNLLDRTAQLALPMFVQDILEASQESPELGAIVGPLSSIGFGTQTYGGGGDFGAPRITPHLGLEEFDLAIGR
jgi:hypothetical protein